MYFVCVVRVSDKHYLVYMREGGFYGLNALGARGREGGLKFNIFHASKCSNF